MIWKRLSHPQLHALGKKGSALFHCGDVSIISSGAHMIKNRRNFSIQFFQGRTEMKAFSRLRLFAWASLLFLQKQSHFFRKIFRICKKTSFNNLLMRRTSMPSLINLWLVLELEKNLTHNSLKEKNSSWTQKRLFW